MVLRDPGSVARRPGRPAHAAAAGAAAGGGARPARVPRRRARTLAAHVPALSLRSLGPRRVPRRQPGVRVDPARTRGEPSAGTAGLRPGRLGAGPSRPRALLAMAPAAQRGAL